MNWQVSSLFNTRILFCDSNGKRVELCPTGTYQWKPGQVQCKSLQEVVDLTSSDDVVGYVANINGWWTSILRGIAGNIQVGKKERSRDVAISVVLTHEVETATLPDGMVVGMRAIRKG